MSTHALTLSDVLVWKNKFKNTIDHSKSKTQKKAAQKNLNCFRIPSTGNYVNLYLQTTKTSILNFMMVVACILQGYSFYMQKLHKTKI